MVCAKLGANIGATTCAKTLVPTPLWPWNARNKSVVYWLKLGAKIGVYFVLKLLLIFVLELVLTLVIKLAPKQWFQPLVHDGKCQYNLQSLDYACHLHFGLLYGNIELESKGAYWYVLKVGA